ncbi:glutamine amidotransferase-related protein [Burkholderia perseverans]|uniref:glutamine amidotransferase-related protein n=1 Tax=Burkholderia perseverans TaxID=2615214 RepID=UPI001FEF5A21|nr:gamma-glutamyl-gamma-aminobutyrate hydrolase family protein [Burkholderia perseverans]
MLDLVADDADAPAQYGVLAARLAQALGLPLRHLSASFDIARHADALQHVSVDGALVPSGLLWADRLGGPPVGAPLDPAALLALAAEQDVVVPFHPANARALGPLDQLVAQAEQARVPVIRYRVAREAGSGIARVVAAVPGARETVHGLCAARQDRFGRWRDADGDWDDDASGDTDDEDRSAVGTAASTPLHIVLVGREDEQREGYPATLAALADAADAVGVALRVRFVAAQTLDDGNVAAALAGCDGVVLPGGADMARVAGQIAAAGHAWRSGTPVVGLCLGMQSMATAVARHALARRDIGMLEAEPGIRLPSFMPIESGPAGEALVHRLGRQTTVLAPGSRLHALLGPEHAIRCNHRYQLNPALDAPLAAAGVAIVARDDTGRVADAIEARDHPFFIGMQGHPELDSTDGAAHPLLCAFLDTVLGRVG